MGRGYGEAGMWEGGRGVRSGYGEEGVGKGEHLVIVGRNTNWCHHSRNHYGSSSESRKQACDLATPLRHILKGLYIL